MTTTTTLPLETPPPHRFTRAEYYQMAELGFFEDRRVELIDGVIVDMAPQKDFHAAGVLLTQHALQRKMAGFLVRTQMPLDLGRASDPEPDISVVTGDIRDYVGTGHPKSAVLVVEVSDTTLRFDRGKKASLYARAGIADYWILNLIDNLVEVRRNPVADPAAPFGWRYDSVSEFRPPQAIAPLARPDALIPVAELLP
jgi:Uma2 family endonuclease